MLCLRVNNEKICSLFLVEGVATQFPKRTYAPIAPKPANAKTPTLGGLRPVILQRGQNKSTQQQQLMQQQQIQQQQMLQPSNLENVDPERELSCRHCDNQFCSDDPAEVRVTPIADLYAKSSSL